jgi:hypothetical protein
VGRTVEVIGFSGGWNGEGAGGNAALGRWLRNTGHLIVFQRDVPKEFHLCKRRIDILFPLYFHPLTGY